jgi:hypothetical protein
VVFWIILGVALAMLLTAVVLWLMPVRPKEDERLPEHRPWVIEPVSMVRIVDQSVPLTKPREVFDGSELADW